MSYERTSYKSRMVISVPKKAERESRLLTKRGLVSAFLLGILYTFVSIYLGYKVGVAAMGGIFLLVSLRLHIFASSIDYSVCETTVVWSFLVTGLGMATLMYLVTL